MTTEAFLQQLVTDADKLNALADEAKDWALHHGLLIRTHEAPNSSEVVTYAPFTLFPTPVPKTAIMKAMKMQTHINLLVDKISQNPTFLEEALEDTVQADDFMFRLFGIYKQVQEEGQRQSIAMGLIRSDYMVERGDEQSLKQIEINTIAVGGFGVSDNLPAVHRHVLTAAGLSEETERVEDVSRTPQMSAALAKAWELYDREKAVILFLVEDFQINKLNQRCIEKELWNRKISVIYRRFEEVLKQASLDDEKRLFVDGLEVAVVYFHYGQVPEQYNERSWDARLLLERSLAVKCPDIGTHLAGSKKIQQVIVRPNVLEKFFPDQSDIVEEIRATFAGLHSLDMDQEGDWNVGVALENPQDYVLKPQREGGGNNLFGEAMVPVLTHLKNDKKRAAYILMDRLQSRTEHNILVRRGLPLSLACVSYEIGVCGAYVRHGEEMVLNESVGPVLRTKGFDAYDDGMTVYDTPLLS